jgi:signal transduction histidine kinase
MTSSIVSWLRRSGFLPWGLGFILFLAYDVVLGLAVTGRTVLELGTWAWLLVWLPSSMARLFAPKDAYLFQPQVPVNEEPPPVSSGLTGICWALMAAGLLLLWTHEAALRHLAPLDHGEVPGFVSLVVFLLVAFSLATVPTAAIRANRYYTSQSRRLIEAEAARGLARAQVLQSQMQPHFLFNALNTVTALLREEPARGRDVLLRLRGLLERSLVTSSTPMIALENEVAFVRDQLAIEQERFRDRLTVAFDVDETLLSYQVPAFCLQPLVENALRHGIARSIGRGHVLVKISQGSGPSLRLQVTDTGAGLDAHWKKGTGLSNLEGRLAATYGSAASVSVTADGHQTTAVVTLPLQSRIRD